LPIPPKENYLPVAIEAGEKSFGEENGMKRKPESNADDKNESVVRTFVSGAFIIS
jgi:hypothetical protein